MSSEKFVNIARLMTTYNFEFEQVPDNLKCAQCKLVLKNACQVPCGCSFCNVCINDMRASGIEFCPGDSEDCGETLLSTVAPDYRANKRVLLLTAKCAHDGCVYKCQLANMEEHLRECQRRNEECPFQELGCTQNEMATEEISEHLYHDNRRHSEILIVVIANINREIDILKQRDDERGREIEKLKSELVLKNEQIRSIMDQLIHAENENKSIAQGKADLADRVTILSDKLEREIDERCENHELDSARVLDYVDSEITAVKGKIGANMNEWDTQIKSVKDDIGSLNKVSKSISDNICSMKLLLESIQEIVVQGYAKCQLVIDSDVGKDRWSISDDRWSDNFTGKVLPYKYRFATNNHKYIADTLSLWLHIFNGPNDEQLAWPFDGRVTITIADRNKREACKSISRQCRIERPLSNSCQYCDPFMFRHSELREAGLDLSRGVRVSCVIVPGAG